MYKAVFQNSKIALIFAVMTIISAVSMVGTSDDGGVVSRAVSIAEAAGENARNAAAAQAGMVEGGGQAGNGSVPAPVFGEYAPQAPAAPTAPAAQAQVQAQSSANPMTAPLAPTAVVITSGPSQMPFLSGGDTAQE